MMASNDNRVDWIDTAKGIGIILVVFGHILSVSDPGSINLWIYSFHMPLFFFLSGLTLNVHKYSILKFIKNKFFSLMIPYFVFAFLGYLFYLSGFIAADFLGKEIEQFNYGLIKPLTGIFYGTLGDGNLVNGPLWFLVALFMAINMIFIANKLIPGKYIVYIITFTVFLVTLFIPQGTNLPFSVLPATVSLFFIQLGFLCKDIKQKRFNRIYMVILLLFLIPLSWIFSSFNDFVIMGEFILGNYLIFTITSLSGIIIIVVISMFLKIRILSFIGNHSLVIMAVHMLIIKSVKVALSIISGLSMGELEKNMFYILLITVITVILLIPVCYIIKRFFPFSLGQRRKLKEVSL